MRGKVALLLFRKCIPWPSAFICLSAKILLEGMRGSALKHGAADHDTWRLPGITSSASGKGIWVCVLRRQALAGRMRGKEPGS
jgi:hypothetical protein